MPTETANDVLEVHCVASAMGYIPVVKLVDGQTGDARAFACVRGAPVPYTRFLAMLLAVLTDADDRHGTTDMDMQNLIVPIWARVKLAAGARQLLDEGHSVGNVARKLVLTAFNERAKTKGIEPVEQLTRFIREIEEAYTEACENPITVEGLTALYEPLIYAAPWSAPAAKAADAKRAQEAEDTSRAWKSLSKMQVAQQAPPPLDPMLVPPTPVTDKVKAATAKLLQTVRKAQNMGLRVQDDGY